MRAKCLGCREIRELESPERTAAADIVRNPCAVCGNARALWTRVPEVVEQTELPDALEIARGVFGDDLVEPETYAGAYADPLPAGTVIVANGVEAVVEPITAEEIDDASGLGDVVLEVEADKRDDRVERAYREWVATEDGRIVAKAIRDRALELRRRGWTRYGIQALAEVARFDRALLVGPDAAGYRVNNSHLSRLSRDLMEHYPELAEFFETRALTARST